MSNISKDLLLAILALDAYNRGYGAGISDLSQKNGTKVGPARIITNAEKELGEGEAQSAGFYAIAYDTPYGTVISYRGTDSMGGDDDHGGSDVRNGWVIGLGTLTDQSDQAIVFSKEIQEACCYR